MPRIGTSIEELTSGGSQFDFAEGRGRIIAASVYNHEIPGYPPASCAYKLTIQRLDANWKATNDEPQDEIITAGPAGDGQYNDGNAYSAKFHPGRASGPDDNFGGEEPWGNPKYDCGDQDQAEGNVLLANPDVKGVSKDSKLGLFSVSCIEHGVGKKMFNGFAPNLIGLEAHFTRFMMKKPRNSKKDEAPTCLIIGKDGKVNGIETKDAVHKYPDAQTGKAGVKTMPKPPAQTAAPGSRTNGAPAEEAQAQAQPEAATGTEAHEQTASDILFQINVAGRGQTLSRTKLLTRVKTHMATQRVDPKLHKPIEALVQDDGWLKKKADDMDWVVVGAGSGMTVEIPKTA